LFLKSESSKEGMAGVKPVPVTLKPVAFRLLTGMTKLEEKAAGCQFRGFVKSNRLI
jgi:hypothetical protein